MVNVNCHNCNAFIGSEEGGKLFIQNVAVIIAEEQELEFQCVNCNAHNTWVREPGAKWNFPNSSRALNSAEADPNNANDA